MAPPSVPAQIGADDRSITMSRDEWDRARQRALDELDMTYEELAEEARRREFRSTRARMLWVIIGDPET